MKLLIDTNIFLEVLLEQEKAIEASEFLTKANDYSFFITDFSLHSIGLILFSKKKHKQYQEFCDDIFLEAGINLLSLEVDDNNQLCKNSQSYNLDFDDAYQYTAAEKFDLHIVSFDKDFEKTPRGRKLPGEIQ